MWDACGTSHVEAKFGVRGRQKRAKRSGQSFCPRRSLSETKRRPRRSGCPSRVPMVSADGRDHPRMIPSRRSPIAAIATILAAIAATPLVQRPGGVGVGSIKDMLRPSASPRVGPRRVQPAHSAAQSRISAPADPQRDSSATRARVAPLKHRAGQRVDRRRGTAARAARASKCNKLEFDFVTTKVGDTFGSGEARPRARL